MGRIQGVGLRGAKWVVLAASLLATGCAGALGAGAAAVVVGAGIITFTCYDRVSVTVTDRLTGTKLCDAKVTFIKGTSETVATSCYQAPLSTGKYTLRVERRGLATFEEPFEVSEGGDCGQSVQTMYVALDRLNRPAPPTAVTAATAAAPTFVPPPAAAAAPAVQAPPVTAPAPAAAPAPAPAAKPAPATPALPPAPPAPPAATKFPDAP